MDKAEKKGGLYHDRTSTPQNDCCRESTRQEFKSWVKCKDYRQRKDLAVKSAVALANTKGGILLFGVEDDGTITGCPKSDPQALMEAIYDMTRPSLFTEIEPVETSDGVVLVVSVEKSILMLPPPAASITDGWECDKARLPCKRCVLPCR